MVVGSGVVYPEFAVRTELDAADAVRRCVKQVESLLTAVAGRAPGIVLDLDLTMPRLPSAWQGGVLELHEALGRAGVECGLPGALRVTLRAPGEAIRQAIKAGADIVGLETTAGLRLFEQALRAGDVGGLILACAVLAAPAVSGAWSQAEAELRGTRTAGGGDGARPFIRTIIRSWQNGEASEALCAIAIAVCAVRTLASFEGGASGPTREGAWESLIVKAIRGCPVSLSGTHPWAPAVAAMADLWNSGGSLDQTLAECRALSDGRGRCRPAAESAGAFSRILTAGSIGSIAEAIQTCQQPYQRAIAAAYAATSILAESCAQGGHAFSEADRELLAKIDQDLLLFPESGRELLERLREKYGDFINSGEI